MRLKRLLEGLDVKSLKNFKNYDIKSVTHQSNDVIKDGLFICIKGQKNDGNKYIADVVSRGVKCIITEEMNIDRKDVAIIVVDDVRIAMSVVAKNFYNRAVDSLKVVGVVGTSGKTSTSLILSQILSVCDNNIGVIGTNRIFIGKTRLENTFTTPDPLELHYIFYQMKLLGVKTVIMEISAQAIYYKKVYGIYFDLCIFTNISKEHLDFFETMEKYAKVKMDFFNAKNMRECIVNIDDFYGREIAYKVNIPCVSYGVCEPANTFAMKITLGLDNTRFVANVLDDIVNCDVGLVGEYNVYNVLAGLTGAKMLGLTGEQLQKAISKLQVIDGRFNVYNLGEKKVIVDFAHTPDSIEKLLEHIKSHSAGKILSVFGCVGYSDKQKRIDMARAVDKYSDFIIVTSDNPGFASFGEIANDIILGITRNNFTCIEDRFSAISYGFGLMQDGDILVLIGKGAENFQMIEDKRVPYSDKESVFRLMEK